MRPVVSLRLAGNSMRVGRELLAPDLIASAIPSGTPVLIIRSSPS